MFSGSYAPCSALLLLQRMIILVFSSSSEAYFVIAQTHYFIKFSFNQAKSKATKKALAAERHFGDCYLLKIYEEIFKSR